MQIYLILLLIKFLLLVDGEEVFQLNTTLGEISGLVSKSRLGRDFYSFRGIPYAKPPIGDLRFKPPVPVAKWESTLNATADAPICPQEGLIDFKISEDCLYLNVYTKNIGTLKRDKKQSVLFHISGESFLGGSGHSKYRGPEYLMDRNILLVTMNYRLGALGFINTGTKEFPGNLGLKDQVVALKWVQQNIADYGGNPKSVTLFGNSAGGFSALLHMTSPMSRGLFHRVITMSGPLPGMPYFFKPQLELAQRQATAVGCPNESPEVILKCLKNTYAIMLANSVTNFTEFCGPPIMVFQPVVESDFGQERFLIEDPITSYQTGNFHRVPVIAGTVRNEMAHLAWMIIRNDACKAYLLQNFIEFAEVYLLFERNSNQSQYIASELQNAYDIKESANRNAMVILGPLVRDCLILFHMNRFVKLAAKYTPVYYYKVTYVGCCSSFMIHGVPYGVEHTDDVQYLFYLPDMSPLYTKSHPEYETTDRLTRMWVKFARTGDPNEKCISIVSGNWTKYTKSNRYYLEIGNKLKMRRGCDRLDVLNRLFPLPKL